MTELQALRRRWTYWAPIYDLRVRLFLRWRRPAVEALHLRPGDTVLDLACGTGLNFPLLTEHAPGGRIIGADLTRAMLRQASRKVVARGWRHVALIECDAANLPLASESCDAVFCSYGMAIIPEYRRALAEAVRVLRPGGRLALLEPQRGSALWARALTPLVAFAGRFGGVHLDRRPWRELPDLLEDVSRYEYAGGIICIAAGTKPNRP
jgi:demethylmenaquinone methyltransferase/2-methoxy-6-polyprenyl-1,4-benzoquinol methylase